MFVLIIVLMVSQNQEFIKQANINHEEGKVWSYVGATAPDNNPYIPTKANNGDEIILFKMK